MTLRRLVELASRGRSFRRRLPADYGGHPLVVSPDAALRWLKPGRDAFEQSLLDVVDRHVRPGDVVWDLGANVGVFALAAAAKAGAPAVAVEADPFLASLLRRTADLRENEQLRLKVLCGAIGAEAGTAEFAIAGRGRASNGLVDGALSSQHGATRSLLLVPTLAADDLLRTLPTPRFVKVDLEGGELFFLRGATRLLRDVRPTIYIEISEPNLPAARSILTDADYELFVGDGVPVPLGQDRPSDNVLAKPREK